MTLTFEEAKNALHATVRNASSAPDFVIVSTDTRTLQRGQTYLALRGERYDGHAYVEQAVLNGAAALVIENAPQRALEIATLIVADTKAAYMSLAAAARAKFGGIVVAITGSTGKTTTKALLAQLLAARCDSTVAASPGNENNEIGVSKLLLEVPPETQAVIVEMGARHYGDIAALVEIALPQVGILTNVGEAHLEIMGSRERLAETKWSLFSRGARAVLNVHDPVSRARAATLPALPRWFGVGEPRLPGLHPNERGAFVVERNVLAVVEDGEERRYGIEARVPGDHNLQNLAAAIAGAVEMGCDAGELAAAVRSLHLPAGRYESVDLPNGSRVVYDAYNASMSGMEATLSAFAREPASRRIAVLASMAELGDEAPQMHRSVGAHAAQSLLDALLVGGDFAADLALGARSAGFAAERITAFSSNAEALAWLRANLQPGDALLLKGSRVYKLEEILEGLRA